MEASTATTALAALADYRERVVALYRDGKQDGEEGAQDWRARRDTLFRTHPASPLTAEQRAAADGLAYFPYDPGAVVRALLDSPAETAELAIETGGEDGTVRYGRVGRVETPAGGLTLFWMRGYGGGLFLPVRDATSGPESYGGGRYLTDTVKGTFGRGVRIEGEEVVLDFNYLYNPSCAYNSRWLCPLAPPENRLGAPVRAGELAFPHAV